MINHNVSMNLSMVHGGTTFGWMAGANSDGKSYEPTTTS
jgi:beta-galactosidase